MRSWGPVRRAFAGAFMAAAVAVPLGCGDSENGGGSAAETVTPPPVNFPPHTSGRSFRGLLGDLPTGPALAPSVGLLRTGPNRFGFALFDRGNRQIGDLEVALYVARGVDEAAHGPFLARYEKIEVEPEFRSRNTSEDPDSATSVYVAEVNFARPGIYLVSAITNRNGRLNAATPAQVRVRRGSPIPDVGDRAVRVHTPTVEDAGGNIEEIETRVPPDTMHEVDLADALDRERPVILLFSSPALCESRVCGPVTDVAEQVKSEFDDEADFIHVEFYEDNDASKGPRAAARAWGLTSEPLLFAIDSGGRIVERIQGAYSAEELRAAVRKALR